MSKFNNLKSFKGGIKDSFEEFCCQMFRRAPEVPGVSIYRRVHGAGGDGGVEAYWTLPDGTIWGVQAKFFGALGSSERKQATESIMQAVANHPSLTHYTICLPMVLTSKTGAKAGKPKEGGHEKLTEWIADWKGELAKIGRSIEIDHWDESELLGRLASADTTGGLQRYWFDRDTFTPDWFHNRLSEAKVQAGDRYTPTLSVKTPFEDAVQAFGRPVQWQQEMRGLGKRLSERLTGWRRTLDPSVTREELFPEKLRGKGRTLESAAEAITLAVKAADEDPTRLDDAPLRDTVCSALELAAEIEPELKDTLVAEHGKNADTPGFRQMRAEYYVDFPTAALDRLRDLMAIIGELAKTVLQPVGRLPASSAMMLRGEAGVGKTHSIVDSAFRRHDNGLLSLIFFGEDASGADPWQSFQAKLGIQSGFGREALLDALNSAAEATGFPLIIFVDAINETVPDRRRWQSWLPPLIEQIRQRPFLKVCFSCREIYVREVLPTALSIPMIEHNGFLGREFEAQCSFFQHYGLGMPAEPLFQEEFANPLFLRLVCEALRDFGKQAIPTGREGIRAIVDLLLRAKNEKAAARCDYDHRDNRIGRAMLRIAGAMASSGTRSLPLAEAQTLVDESSALQSRSLFAVAESESLLATIERPTADFGGLAQYSVRFTFERVGDHLIAEHLVGGVSDVEEAFALGGPLHFLLANKDAIGNHLGVLEALSIHLPEVLGVELLDVVPVEDDGLWNAFISGIQWRNPQYISQRTIELVRKALGFNDTVLPALEAVLTVSARPDHPLNAQFLNDMLAPIPVIERDSFWAHLLENSFSGWSETVREKSPVHRLIDIARRARLDGLPYQVACLWASVLAWFCASPDRRIRDKATLAMASIFRAEPAAITKILRAFDSCDDEYILERILVAGYGAFTLNPSAEDLFNASCLLYHKFFAYGDPPLNASVRDHARLIIELSLDRKVPPPGLDISLCRPPYNSPWPISLPSEGEVEAYAKDSRLYPQMDLAERFGLATGTDFARYIVEPRVGRAFAIKQAGLTLGGIYSWFLKRAVDFGYPGPNDQSAFFDRKLLAKFGGGRGKPGWAERLGKKYYWIFLRQLVGLFSDHLPRQTWSDELLPPSSELQALDLRDIDPTDFRQFLPQPSGNREWLAPAPYHFTGHDGPDGDAAWSVLNDLTDVSEALVVTDSQGIQWQALDLSATWRGKRENQEDDSYRYVDRHIRAATCEVSMVAKVKNYFSENEMDHFNSGPKDYRGYLGEYPDGLAYTQRFSDPFIFDGSEGKIKFQYLAIDQLRGREWEYDYSQVGSSPSLLMPSVELLQAENLRWDHRGGWLDAEDNTQIQDPSWWSDDHSRSLICRLDYLDRYLEAKNRALIVLGFQLKMVVGGRRDLGLIEERTLFIRQKGVTRFVKRKLEKFEPEPAENVF